MTEQDIKKLQHGDEVYWTDPDDGLCSRYYVIQSIECIGGIVTIETKDGDSLECWARELS